jgi:hypothetical protein
LEHKLMPAIADAPILKRVKSAMQGDSAPKRLSEALAKVQQLKARLAAIEAEQKHHAGRFARYVAECREKFERTKAFEDELAVIQAEVARDWVGQHASSAAEQAAAIYGYGVPKTAAGDAFVRLAKEYPDWRTEIEAVLSLKREIAEQAHQETLATVSEQLSGFGDDSVTNDPRVKRARKEAVRWQQLVKQFAEAKDLDAWRLAVDALFPA